MSPVLVRNRFPVCCLHLGLSNRTVELSHSLTVSDRRRNTPKSAQNRSESLCAGVRAPCRIFWAWRGPALGPNPARNPRFPAGSLKVFGALVAQPSVCWLHLGLSNSSETAPVNYLSTEFGLLAWVPSPEAGGQNRSKSKSPTEYQNRLKTNRP